MADKLALTILFDAVAARFAALPTPVPNTFGWRESAKQGTAPRINWYPGDPRGGMGQIAPARQPGRSPRPLATLEELFTVELSAADRTTPENERAQYEVCRLLYDQWHSFCHSAAYGTWRIVSNDWVGPDVKVRRYGNAIQVVCTVQSMLPDLVTQSTSIHATRATPTLTELDQSETVTVPQE